MCSCVVNVHYLQLNTATALAVAAMGWHAEQATLCAFVGGLCVLQVRSAILLAM